jgi:hypothetical protein
VLRRSDWCHITCLYVSGLSTYGILVQLICWTSSTARVAPAAAPPLVIIPYKLQNGKDVYVSHSQSATESEHTSMVQYVSSCFQLALVLTDFHYY